MTIQCTCELANGPAETTPAELHDEECELYFAAWSATPDGKERIGKARALLAEIITLVEAEERATAPPR